MRLFIILLCIFACFSWLRPLSTSGSADIRIVPSTNRRDFEKIVTKIEILISLRNMFKGRLHMNTFELYKKTGESTASITKPNVNLRYKPYSFKIG